jgi:predicted transcriptional regulator
MLSIVNTSVVLAGLRGVGGTCGATRMLRMALSDTIRRHRRRADYTQEELAQEAGVGVATIARIETGEIEEPRVSTLRKLAKALDLDTRELLAED